MENVTPLAVGNGSPAFERPSRRYDRLVQLLAAGIRCLGECACGGGIDDVEERGSTHRLAIDRVSRRALHRANFNHISPADQL
jgi:hypothetical protein